MPNPPMPWYQKAYRRAVIDMHISADSPAFMSQFDPATYIEMLSLAQVQSAVVYSHSHVGLCYFPTRVGQMHPGLGGRDILSEVISLAHQKNINVVIYMSLIFDTWAYRNHPGWKIYSANGKPAAENSRYGLCCPNSPYREYIRELIGEVCSNYEFEGIRFDMTFWPEVCYCPSCQERYQRETGSELPRIIDWEDPLWVRFQRKREDWLVEFAAMATSTVRRIKPDVSIEHQTSTLPFNWRFGVTERLAEQCTFLQGDFYGDALQGSFARKLFYNLTPSRPAGFETSIGQDLTRYTALKSQEILTCKASAAIADGSAFIFIDSIEPTGVLNPRVYQRMQGVFEYTSPYEPYLGGNLLQDVGIYMSMESKFDPADNHRAVDDPNLSNHLPHVESVVGACQALRESHIPFGVITKANIHHLDDFKLIILPNVLMMSEQEVNAFRQYVEKGGCLYASRTTSQVNKDGLKQKDFMLSEVFGVSLEDETKETYTYIAPMPGFEAYFDGYTQVHPAGFDNNQILVKAHPAAIPLGRLVLPYTNPADPHTFSSIHNNPPGITTDYPAILLNTYGKGKAIYAAIELERMEHARQIFLQIINLLGGSFSVISNAPKSVEITTFYQPERNRYVISLVNFQKELPNIPIDGIWVRLHTDEGDPSRLVLLPSQQTIPFEQSEDGLTFRCPRLETLLMFAIELKA